VPNAVCGYISIFNKELIPLPGIIKSVNSMCNNVYVRSVCSDSLTLLASIYVFLYIFLQSLPVIGFVAAVKHFNK
jgi:hypothetical protein